MSDTFSNTERILLELLAFPSDEDMCDYIIEKKLSQAEILEIAERLSLSDEALQKLSINSLEKQKPPTVKNPHSGIFDHYIQSLDDNPNFKDGAVESIKESVYQTHNRMSIREPKDRKNCYGLVLGRIQSGKTAHLIGTVLRAIDGNYTQKPFNTIIILSGLIDDLRIQTRDRFVGVVEGFNGNSPVIMPDETSDLNGSNDKFNQMLRKHLKPNNFKSSILVIKKNHKILENLLDILSEKQLYQRRKFLIIDDEADHASMDTNASSYEVVSTGEVLDEDPSLTNQLLRAIVKLLSKSALCWYIGYTATPYANLIMMPHSSTAESEFGLSLFPRDFFHALPKPNGHLDNEFYFASPPGHEHVVLRNPPESSEQEDSVVKELIMRHLLTQIVKSVKGMNKHHTTLVHTDVAVEEHHKFAELFRIQLNEIRNKRNSSIIVNEMKEYLDDYELSSTTLQNLLNHFGKMSASWELLSAELRKITVVEVNRRDQEEDDTYSQDLLYNRGIYKKSYIAVGGTRLSRGLTLEGLTTTWFTRAASTPVYDTMLQMARWCGYRSGFDELVKIFTTTEIAEYYHNITEVEKDIRTQIETLKPETDPMDTLVWIKEYSGMNVTAKMPSEYTRTDWGQVSQPILWTYEPPYFHDNAGMVSQLLFAQVKRLLLKSGGSRTISNKPKNGLGSFKVGYGIKNKFVKDFLVKYFSSYEDSDNSLAKVRLNQILNQWSESVLWNIAVHTPQSSRVKRKENLANIEIGLVQRKTEQENSRRFSIVQSSADDIRLDLENNELRENPLLVIYLINPDSLNSSKGRVFKSDVKQPVVAFGLILPKHLVGQGGTKIARTEE